MRAPTLRHAAWVLHANRFRRAPRRFRSERDRASQEAPVHWADRIPRQELAVEFPVLVANDLCRYNDVTEGEDLRVRQVWPWIKAARDSNKQDVPWCEMPNRAAGRQRSARIARMERHRYNHAKRLST